MAARFLHSQHFLLCHRLKGRIGTHNVIRNSRTPSIRVAHSPLVCLAASNPPSRLFASPPPRPPPGGRVGSTLAAVGSGALLLAGKGKYVLGALKLTKFASLGSMLLSVGAYSTIFGLPYAAGMVGQLLVHESGHALVMMRYGIPFSPMVFVPFVGAVVSMKEMPRDAHQEAMIAFGGPVMGTLGAISISTAAHAMDSQLLFALADFGYMINLFNLLPIGTLDGGRICGALSPWSGVAGLGAGGALIYGGVISNPIFYLIMMGGTWTTFSRFYYGDVGVPPNYYKIKSSEKGAITVAYFGLIGSIVAAMAANKKRTKPPEAYRNEPYWVEM